MDEPPASLTLHLPGTIRFGPGCAEQLAPDLIAAGGRVLAVVSRSMAAQAAELLAPARDAGVVALTWHPPTGEPTVTTLHAALDAVRDARPDTVVGIGGGSVLDLAKLIALFLTCDVPVHEAFGIDKAPPRCVRLICIPTTAGAGSEVSPNAILLDEDAQLKKGIVSRGLVPDAAYVDPRLTVSLPPHVTAATGLDALTHCIEAYANRFAHPLVDTFALRGVALIGRSLRRACEHGDDLAARGDLALGSLYGGMCLGPVNTAAVHALAYPLGGEFHVPHGVSNAVLLPHVMRFNLPAAAPRYADVADALGVEPHASTMERAAAGIEHLAQLARDCGVPQSLADLGIPEAAVPRMAEAAMRVTRLLERNVRPVTRRDAERIYREAFACNASTLPAA